MRKESKFLVLLILSNLVLVTVLGFAISEAVEPGSVKVVLKPSAMVHETTVRLEDIAEVSGLDQELVMKLRNVPITNAPALGQQDVLDKSTVRECLESREWAHGVIFEGPSVIDLTRASVRIPEEKLIELGRSYVEDNMPWKKDRVKIISPRAAEVVIPETDVSFEVTPRRSEDYLGEVVLLISVKSDDSKILKQVWWRAELVVETDVVVAGHDLVRGNVISEKDVTLKSVTLDGNSKNALTTPDGIIGKRMRKGVKEGDMLSTQFMEEAPLIKIGQVVTLIVETQFLRVRTKGMAKEQGRLGEMVRVVNSSSKKEIVGQVMGPAMVKAAFE